MVQLSHPYMTTGKTIAFTIRTFVGKVMSLLCWSDVGLEQELTTEDKPGCPMPPAPLAVLTSSPLSRFVIAFLPKSKHLLTTTVTTSVPCPQTAPFWT